MKGIRQIEHSWIIDLIIKYLRIVPRCSAVALVLFDAREKSYAEEQEMRLRVGPS